MSNTITIHVTKNVTSQKEVTLPVFRKSKYFAYKVISKEKCVSVFFGDMKGPEIGIHHAELAWNQDDVKDCSEEKFMELYNATQERINQLVKG